MLVQPGFMIWLNNPLYQVHHHFQLYYHQNLLCYISYLNQDTFISISKVSGVFNRIKGWVSFLKQSKMTFN